MAKAGKYLLQPLRAIWLTFLVLIVSTGCSRIEPEPADTAEPNLCADSWYQEIERKVPSGDTQGHGPDIGSNEWKSVIEFRLGIRGNPELPNPESSDWCAYIDQLLQQKAMDSNPESTIGHNEQLAARIQIKD